MEAFLGRWEIVSSEKFNEYMKAIGLTDAMRQYGNNMKSQLIISQDGDKILIKTKMQEATDRNVKLFFKLGEEFDEQTVDFRRCKTVITLEGGKLIQVQKWDGKEGTIIREIQDGTLITTLKFGDVASVRTYKRI